MNELKCPFCQQELNIDNYYTHCDNPHCNTTVEMEGTEEMWAALIRTRKALDVAKDKLDTVRQYHRGTAVIRPDDIAAYCDRAIKQITALEQKDLGNSKIKKLRYIEQTEYDKLNMQNEIEPDCLYIIE